MLTIVNFMEITMEIHGAPEGGGEGTRALAWSPPCRV